ncbi:hypothetical protein PHYC_03140 [Phycisphaerales bacterium]|nr:hypothetical protein PHYC_03140 [Phycisphaerales bacterium]
MTVPPSNPGRAGGIDPVDAYLDNLMTPDERAAFERRLARDADLRELIELQKQIDGSLVRQLPYRAPTPAPAAIPISRAAGISWTRIRWIGAIAAIVALAFITVLYVTQPPALKFRAPDLVYRDFDAAGWKPAWVCKDDREFAEMVSFYLDSAVVVPLDTPGVTLAGWSLADQFDHGKPIGTPMSQQTLALLTKVDGKNVLVLMDRLSSDRKMRVSADSGLFLHRRELNGLVLYEVSPMPEARVLPKALPAEGRPKPGPSGIDGPNHRKGTGKRSRGSALIDGPSDLSGAG